MRIKVGKTKDVAGSPALTIAHPNVSPSQKQNGLPMMAS
jgi:hypothetical protein